MIWPVNRIRIALKFFGDMLPDGIKIDWNGIRHNPYFTRPTIRSLGPDSLIRCTSVSPAAFIQPEYSVSL